MQQGQQAIAAHEYCSSSKQRLAVAEKQHSKQRSSRSKGSNRRKEVRQGTGRRRARKGGGEQKFGIKFLGRKVEKKGGKKKGEDLDLRSGIWGLGFGGGRRGDGCLK